MQFGCNKKALILEPWFCISWHNWVQYESMDFGTQIFKFFFFLMQLGASKFDALKCYVQMGVVSFCHPFWTYFTKAKRTKKNTIYDLHTHTHTHTHMHKFVLLLPHDFSFFHIPSIASSLRLFSTWFGYLSLKCWKFYLLLKIYFWESQLSLECKCWKSLTPKNWRFFMLGLVSMCILHTPQLLNIMWIQNFTIN